MSNAKLKIGFVFDDTLDSSDGVSQYVRILGKWLGGKGHEVRYLVGETKMSDWAGGKVYSLSRNYKVSFNGNRLSTPGPANLGRLRQILCDEHFDVLHVQVPYSPFMAARVINAAPRGTAVVGTFHIMPSGLKAAVGARALKLALFRSARRFDTMLSVSEAARQFAKKAFGYDSRILPNTIEIGKFKSPGGTKRSGQHVVFLGRLVERKGARQLIDAFALLRERLPKVHLTVAGTGPQADKLKARTRSLGLQKAVKFTGFVDEQKKPALLASADIACFPAVSGESFGIVLLEAMAAGAGVVLGGDNPGYRSVLGAREQLLVDPNDRAELAARLELLLTDKHRAKDLHDWQTAQVQNYDVNRVGQQLLNIYRETIAKKGPPGHNKVND